LAKTISENLGLKIFLGLEKIKETEDQVGLSFEERLTNLKNAFQVKEKPPNKIILIDDIKTTGATLKECAQILKKAGAKEIIALTILR
jgi:competence protein ComFC